MDDRTKGRGRRKPLTRAQRWVIYLAILVLTLGVINLVRLIGGLFYAAHLADLAMTVSWTYLAVSGGLWFVAFLACVVGLVRFRPWGRWATLVAVTLYAVYFWADYFLFVVSEYAQQRWSYQLAITLVLLALVWVFLNLPRVRGVFKRSRRRAARDA